MKKIIFAICFLSFFNNAYAEKSGQNYVKKIVENINNSPNIINSIIDQNNKHKMLNENDILQLDQNYKNGQYQEEILNNSVSKELKLLQDSFNGLLVEIFVMDNKGLNVGMSEATGDYWQGDESKFQKTFNVGPNAIHISEIEQDESTGVFSYQLSHTLVDSNGNPVGAVTLTVDVEKALEY